MNDKDMILPYIGVMLYYFVIYIGINYRYDVSDWGASWAGGDLVLVAGAYLVSILIVALWCNLQPFNMWGINTTYPGELDK